MRSVTRRLRTLGVDLPPVDTLGASALLAQLRVAVAGDLDRVVRCVRLSGYVNSTPEFAALDDVVDGASDLFVEVFGRKGRHSRLVVAVNALRGGAAVQVDAVFEIRSRELRMGVRGLA
jgi:enamine deaminase RidA (YjgF/YER057c/UK114 family)